jgi:protein SCO1/2
VTRRAPVVAALLLALAAAAGALPPQLSPEKPAANPLPGELGTVGFDQRLGAILPLDLPFRDETGREVRLGELFGTRPVLMAFVYHSCPMLCTLIQNGIAAGLKPLKLEPGRDFDVVMVSFDPADTPESAARKKQEVLSRYGRPETAAGWHFLVGGEESIRALTEAVGFRYVFDTATQQFAHASGTIILTPDGRPSRYLYGIDYAPKDLRLAFVESSEGKIGNLVDQFLLLCFHYDENLGKYSAAAMLSLRFAAGLTVVILIGLVAGLALRERRQRRAAAGGVV